MRERSERAEKNNGLYCIESNNIMNTEASIYREAISDRQVTQQTKER
jgi:hypothetical protein